MIGFLINLVVGVVLSLASTLLQQAFAQKPKTATGTRSTVEIGGKVPQYFLMGTVAEAGKREYRNAWGHNGDVPNAYLTDVLSFGDLPITAMIGGFVNGTRITLGSTGAVAQGFKVPEFDNKLWWKFLNGSQATADSYLVSKFGGDADRAWTADMIGRGVPVVITTALWDEKLWTKIPEFVGEFQGIPLYDVTKDSTAGGVGPQRWADKSTWAFSDNNAVMIYNILRGIFYGSARVWGGSCEASQLPYDVWAAAINACNQNVALGTGGTEKRFRAGRRVNLNERPADVIQELLIGCNGRISHASDGTVYILIGVPDEADGAFSDDDVLATEPLGSIPFPNLDGIVNGATATYREPNQAWEDKETAPYYRSDLEAEDDGRQQLQGLDLGTTFSGTQAQRILKAVIEEGRRFRTHVVGLPPEFGRYRPLNVLAWTSSRFGYIDKLFLITARTRDPWGNVVFGLQEIDPADHDWVAEEDERALYFAPVVINRPPPQPMTGWSVAPYTYQDSTGNDRRPGIELGFAPGFVDVRAVRVQIRRDGEVDPFFDGDFPYDPTIVVPTIYVINNAILPNQPYEARGIYIPFSGRATDWSGWLGVVTPDIRLGVNDINIELDELAADISARLDWVTSGVRGALEAFKRIGSIIAEQDLDNYNSREALKREIGVRLDTVEASFVEVIEVALGPGGAIATALSSLYAAMGGNSAEVNVRWEALATPAGVSARYGVALRTALADGGTFRTATMYAEVPQDPTQKSRWVFDSQQFVLVDTTSGEEIRPILFEAGNATLEELRFKRLRSKAQNTDGTPIIEIDGETGYFGTTIET